MLSSIFGRALSSSDYYSDVSIYNNPNPSAFPTVGLLDSNRISACQSDFWLLNLGYILIIGSLFVKTYRISVIFNSKAFKDVSSTKLSNWYLLGILIVLLTIQVIVLLGVGLGGTWSLSLLNLNNGTNAVYCTSSIQDAITAAILVVRFTLLAMACVYSYTVRDVPSSFNESRQLAVSLYNLTFLSIFLPIIESLSDAGTDTAVIVYSAVLFAIVISITLIVMAPKFYKIYTKDDDVAYTTKVSQYTTSANKSGTSGTKYSKGASSKNSGIDTNGNGSYVSGNDAGNNTVELGKTETEAFGALEKNRI